MAHGKHTRNAGWKPGEHWVVCDICGFDYRQSVMKKTWDGFVVCPEDYETRHPQEFVRGRTEHTAAHGLVRPPAQDTFVTGTCSTTTSVAGEAIAGCAVAGAPVPVPTGTF